MLNAHLQVSISGPEPGTREAQEVINKAKEKWVLAKPWCKFPKKVVSVLVRDQGVQANLSEDLDSEEPDRVCISISPHFKASRNLFPFV